MGQNDLANKFQINLNKWEGLCNYKWESMKSPYDSSTLLWEEMMCASHRQVAGQDTPHDDADVVQANILNVRSVKTFSVSETSYQW